MKINFKNTLVLLFICSLIIPFLVRRYYTLSTANKQLDDIQEELALSYEEATVHVIKNIGRTGRIIILGRISSTTSEKVVEALKAMEKTHQEINIYISSRGGIIFPTLAITDTIKQLNIKVNTYALATCISAGSYILASGTGKRTVSKYTELELHFINRVNKPQPNTYNYLLNKLVARFWKENSNLPKNINVESSNLYPFSPIQGKNWGIIDEIK